MRKPNPRPSELIAVLFDSPLYQPVDLDSADADATLRSLRTTAVRLDRHCPVCIKETTWTHMVKPEDNRNAQIESAVTVSGSGRGGGTNFKWDGDFTLKLTCGRRGHECLLFFDVEGVPAEVVFHNSAAKTEAEKTPLPPTKVRKIGQYPSLADFQLGELKELEEGMTVQQRKEFVRAIQTSAHGFNVAACVHYRRVFESVLLEARDAKMQAEGLKEWPDFDRMRTDERIASLRHYLPDFMVEHPHLYGILSKGVHELTEEDCGEAMPVLRQAIELMIQDKVDAVRREKRRQAASVMLAQTVDKHK